MAYKLELPIVGKIYPVVSVAQLEPLIFGENLYHRPKFNHLLAVEMENDIPTYQSYEIKKLVDNLMKWLKYGPEHDQWKKNPFSTIV